ncbi:MAG: hypothetical protein U0230_15160 [Polyangiales bacterium]
MSLPVQVAGTGGARIPMGAVETAPTGHGAEVAEAASALSTALGQASPDGGLDAQRLIDETGRQVRSTDERIRDVQTSMQRDLDSMDALSRQQSALQSIREAVQQKTTEAGKQLELATLEVHVGTEVRSAAELASQLGLGLGTTVSQDSLASRIDALDTQRKSLEGRQEMRQLALQDLLHRRGQLLELASNLLRSLNEVQKSLVANVGR